MDIEFLVYSRGSVYNLYEVCEGKITLATFKSGKASELNFTVVRNIKSIKFFEGDRVSLRINSYNIFCGYIFRKVTSKSHFISVTAYDQLRYLKAKDTYSFSYVKASDIVKKIISDFNLSSGVIEDSSYVIASRIEQNQTLFDIILNAADITKKAISKEFILFDDFGNISFKKSASMKLPFAILDEDKSVIDFIATTDIDSDTFNRIKLLRADERSGFYSVVTVDDDENIKKWGVLQYFEKIHHDTNDIQTISMANSILNEKNRVLKTLHITSYALNDKEVLIRAGSQIFVKLSDIGEECINSWLTVQKCIHTFENNKHIIDVYF